MSLLKKLMKNSTSEYTDTLEKSVIFSERDIIPTAVPMLNVALSGDTDGGLTSGTTVLAGASKNFKSGFALLMASAYLKQYDDAVMLFYNSEFGTPNQYFENFRIDPKRVVTTPVETIEGLRHDVAAQLEGIERGDKVIIVIDSVGNLASDKEVKDAVEGSSKADMTRAKIMKSFFRIVTPKVGLRNIPLIAINHVYKEMSLFPKDIVSGGTGPYYSADTIFIIGRRQEVEGKGKDKVHKGFNFDIKIEKSRFVKEHSKIPISFRYEGGIHKWSGMFDTAVDLGYLKKVGNKYVARGDEAFDQILQRSRKDIEYSNEFWDHMFSTTDLKQAIHDKYILGGSMLEEEEKENGSV
jgi:hypothetical protein